MTQYWRGAGRITGALAEDALARSEAISAGRSAAFTGLEVLERRAEGGMTRRFVPAREARHRADLARLLPPETWAGLRLDRPRIMGIVNVTPDSFSDGGRYLDPERAIAHGLALLESGADILDVGGESTRPGAEPVPAEIETARVVPVIRGLAEAGALISVDTRRHSVMKAALAAGARIVNDVTALGDPDSRRVVAEAGVPVILMHMQGEPGTMQIDPHYDAVALDVFDALDARVRAAVEAGIPRERILVDPGIGFGKTLEHNVALIAILDLLRLTGAGILLGVSRKRFLSSLAGGGGVEDRLPGSLAAGLAGIARGADVLRVHDVRETKRALAVALAIDRAP